MGLFGDKQDDFNAEKERNERHRCESESRYDDSGYEGSRGRSGGSISGSINSLLKLAGFCFVGWFILKLLGF